MKLWRRNVSSCIFSAFLHLPILMLNRNLPVLLYPASRLHFLAEPVPAWLRSVSMLINVELEKHWLSKREQASDVDCCMHGLRTPGEEIAFTARPKINSHSQIFRPKFSDFFDLWLHWVSVVRAFGNNWNFKILGFIKNLDL